MRYRATCPRCQTRVGRVAYLRWGIDRQCAQCHARLKENERNAWWWSVPFVIPGGVAIGLAVCGVAIWEVAISVFVIGMVLGYVLFPYVTKLEIVDEKTKNEESPTTQPYAPTNPAAALWWQLARLVGRGRSIRPIHTWWLGVALFTPSVLIWAFSLGLFIYKGMFNCPFDRHGIIHIYLPLFAAVVGFVTPLICLRVLRQASWRRTRWLFAAYLAVVLTWGIIDIRHEHYQMGGHEYPNGPLVDGHRYYWHIYYTWYFLPYQWIERGIAA